MVLTCVPTLSTTTTTTVCVFVCYCTVVLFWVCGNSFAWLPHIFTFLACGANTLRRYTNLFARLYANTSRLHSSIYSHFLSKPMIFCLGYRRRKSLLRCRRIGCRLRRSRCCYYMYLHTQVRPFKLFWRDFIFFLIKKKKVFVMSSFR